MRTLRSGRSGVRRIAVAVAAAVALVAGGAAIAIPATAADEPFNVALASGDNAPTVEVS